jgi:hypothetical protein
MRPSVCALVLLLGCASSTQAKSFGESSRTIDFSIDPADGSYFIVDPASRKQLLHARVAVQIDHHWLRSNDYPRHPLLLSDTSKDTSDRRLTVVNTGLSGQPDLIYSLELHNNPDFVMVAASVRNRTTVPITVQTIRPIEAIAPRLLNLSGARSKDRVLSDSFSEDRPAIRIHDLADSTNAMHRAVGSQLIYNLDSKRSFFVGAITSERFLTIIRLHTDNSRITAYEVDCTGTTELTRENSLSDSPPEDRVELTLPVEVNSELHSEKLLISTNHDYHEDLENYGKLIRVLHHARVDSPSLAGWWSWTAYYYGLNQDTALTNASWLAGHLKHAGYNIFHIDEGYQYAHGEYITPDAALFPDGMKALESRVAALGLIPGIWTAPFQVSERSDVYQHHKDWLVRNATGQPIRAGWVDDPRIEQLYVLDCTNPDAQEYLRRTYATLTREWGIRYIKLDFMEDSAVEGYYYRPNTTALEAQRVGLGVIRDTVGNDVILDKDGSPMLNPVGIVDTGRLSIDTAHTFNNTRAAATGIAARYYMNRNFYVSDPDAFNTSRSVEVDRQGHRQPPTLSEAQVSIALAAIAGGMYEIGDDLPTLGADPERMALVRNEDLFNMARLGRASRPVDLMSYGPEDTMPSIFMLRESQRQMILTVFNWTERPTSHHLDLKRDLGLQVGAHNQVLDVLNNDAFREANVDAVNINLPPHSVKVLKLIDTSVAPAAPVVTIHVPDMAPTGAAVQFSADADQAAVPVLAYHWDFGDGTVAEGAEVAHAFTRAGKYTTRLQAEGLDGIAAERVVPIDVTGDINTAFEPSMKRRLPSP